MASLNWIGKEAVVNHHDEVPYRLLQGDPSLSVGEDGGVGSGNLLVQGDNLEALKALLPYYGGKIKCIYIDPPYNTGNEGWVYNDNVNSPEMKAWLERTLDGKLKPVGGEGEDLSRHDKWLCMMYPRVQLLHTMLADDGYFIVHLDEHEFAAGVALFDEIFQRPNRIGTIVWDKGNPKGDAQGVSVQHESVLIYAKRKSEALARRAVERAKPNATSMLASAKKAISRIGKEFVPDDITAVMRKYKLAPALVTEHKRRATLDDARAEYAEWVSANPALSGGERMYNRLAATGKVYRLVSMAWPNKKRAPEEYFKPLIHPHTNRTCPVPDRGWRNPPDTMKALLDSGLIEFGEDESVQPQRVYFLEDNLQENLPSVLRYAGSDDSLFADLRIAFENPKPWRFAISLLDVFTNKEDLVLDSFAGSGTTGHAVLAMNKADGGDRRFICIEMDADTCTNTTAQRLTKVIEGYHPGGDKTKSKVEGLGGGFRYVTLGPPLFDEFGHIVGDVHFCDLAAHVFFTETGEPIPKRVNGKKTPFIGACKGTAYYLLYNGILGDKAPDGGNVLTGEVLENLPKFAGPRVVFGEACRLGPARLARESVTFKQIPYDVKGR